MKSVVAANQVLRKAVGALLLVAVSLLPAAAQVAEGARTAFGVAGALDADAGVELAPQFDAAAVR